MKEGMKKGINERMNEKNGYRVVDLDSPLVLLLDFLRSTKSCQFLPEKHRKDVNCGFRKTKTKKQTK